MKQCPTCGAVYSDDFEFCGRDGERLSSAGSQSAYASDNGPAQKTTNLLLPVIVAVLFLVIGVLGTLLVIKYRNDKDEKQFVNVPAVSPTPALSPVNTATPTPSPTPDKAQLQRLINEKIKSVLFKDGLDENEKKYRKILYGDLEGDGDEDAAVHYGWHFVGGNGWGNSLMILVYENGEYKFAADEVVGGKMSRGTELKSIKNGKIFIETMSYTEDDGACCPSIKGSTVFSLKGGKLIEAEK